MNRDPESPARYWLFWLPLALAAAAYLPFAWQENTAGFLTDDAMYLLLADFFSPYHDGYPLVDLWVIDHARFPPAFPMLLALAGAGSEHMAIAHLVTCATFLLSAALLYVWASRALGSRPLGAAVMAIYALLPKTLVYAAEIWSEFLYMALVLAAFILMDSIARHVIARSKTTKQSGAPEFPDFPDLFATGPMTAPRAVNNADFRQRELLVACALVVSLTLLTRSIGLALLASFLLFLFLFQIRHKLLYLLVVAALPLCWRAIKLINDYGGSYTEDLRQYLSWDGAFKLLLADMPHNAMLSLQSWGRHLAVEPGDPWALQGLAWALLALALLGGVKRAMARYPDPFYIVVYLAIVLVWPYPDHNTRFIYPLVPPGLVYLFTGLSVITTGLSRHQQPWPKAGLALLILLLITPNASFVVNRFFTPQPEQIRDDFRHTRFWFRYNLDRSARALEAKQTVINMMRRVDERIAWHECIYAVHPVTVMLYSHRPTTMVPERITGQNFRRCRYLFVMNLVGKYDALYPLNDMDQSRLKLIDIERDRSGTPHAFLFRIKDQNVVADQASIEGGGAR